MKTLTTNLITVLSRWTRFIGISLIAGPATVLLLVFFMGGCKKETAGIINTCLPPTVTRTFPDNGDTTVPLNKIVGGNITRAKASINSVIEHQKLNDGGRFGTVAAVKIITATFSTPMDPTTITTSTFTVRQGSTVIAGSVSYSDTTAYFIAPVGLDPSLTYTCTITTGVRDLARTALATNYIWTFKTIGPGTPTLVSPANGVINISTNPTMVWNTVPGASTYRLQISTAGNFATLVFDDSTITGTSQPISGLALGTTYYWRVNSKISGTTSNYSSVWNFTIITPGTPTLVSPLDGSVNISANPVLVWNTVPGANTYRLQVSTSNLFTTIVYDDSTIIGVSQSLSALTIGATYYWRVNSKISGGTSAYSTIWSFIIAAPPVAPVLVSPLPSEQNQATSLTVSWNASTGANTYRLQVSTTNSFATTIYNDSTVTGTSQPITGLTVGTTYYWRVNAKNGAGTSAYSTRDFTTIAPGTPTLVAPIDGAINVATNPTLIWNTVTGATSYRLQVSTTNNFATTVYNDSTLTAISHPMSGLSVGTTYYWRVNSKISAGTSAYSTVWSFTIIAPPAPPVLLSPLASAPNQATNLSVSWNASVGATTYRLQVSTTNNFATTIFNDSTLTNTSQPITALSVGTTYYWRVSAKNIAGTSAYSTRDFTTIAPGTPTLVSPLDGAVNISTNPTLIWNTVPGATSYRLQASISSNFSTTIFNDSTLTGISQSLSGLNVGTTYYWRVNSKISGGTSAYSNVWSFTTTAPPPAPVLASPLNLAQNQATALTLNWNTSIGASTYRLQVSTVNNFTSTVFNDSTISGTSQQITGLAVGTIYYWRANAKNVAGTSVYSTVWSFTTIAAPAVPTLSAPLNTAINQSMNPTLIWNSVLGADTYRLQVSTTNNFATTVYDDSTRTSTSQPISNLTVNSTYYWRVNAKNVAGTSSYSTVWSFTTVAAPAVPVLSSPLNAAINQSMNPTLIWNSVLGADTYRLQVSLSPGFVSTVYDDTTRTNTSQQLSNLNVNATYYWRVNAKNVAGTSAYSTVWNFTTIAPPAAPVLLSPFPAAQNQPTSLTLSWFTSLRADTYRLQIDTNSNFTTLTFDDSTITGTSQPITGLLIGTKYYWRVNAKNTAGTSGYSTRTFTTIVAALLPPILSSPADAATFVSTTPTLSWNPSTGAATYHLQVDTSSVFASTVFDDSTLTGLSQPLTGLTNGQTYYWRVDAKNSGGTSGYSTTWRFTTEPPPLPPIELGVSARFGSFGGNAGITNQGIYTRINGSIGTTAATTLITGFHDTTGAVYDETVLNIGAVRDTIYTATTPPGLGAVATQAALDAQNAFDTLAGLPGGPDPNAGELGGLVLAPGNYTAAGGTFKISLLDLTLDAQGDSNARFVFQMASSLTVGVPGAGGARTVHLVNNAQSKNVFWVVGTGGGGAATINYAGGGTMEGTIIAYSGVTFSSPGVVALTTLNGRALGLNASVTVVNTIINVPLP